MKNVDLRIYDDFIMVLDKETKKGISIPKTAENINYINNDITMEELKEYCKENNINYGTAEMM